jgi:hypothetical protein
MSRCALVCTPPEVIIVLLLPQCDLSCPLPSGIELTHRLHRFGLYLCARHVPERAHLCFGRRHDTRTRSSTSWALCTECIFTVLESHHRSQLHSTERSHGGRSCIVSLGLYDVLWRPGLLHQGSHAFLRGLSSDCLCTWFFLAGCSLIRFPPSRSHILC